jgi:hypothetical protein
VRRLSFGKRRERCLRCACEKGSVCVGVVGRGVCVVRGCWRMCVSIIADGVRNEVLDGSGGGAQRVDCRGVVCESVKGGGVGEGD